MNHTELQDMINHCLETRIFAYDLLKRTFWEEPTPEFLSIIAENGFMESFPWSEENASIREGVDQLTTFFWEHDVKRKSVYEALHWDYTRMFIGPDQLPAPLWESAYLNKERLLFQEQTLKVRQAYLHYQFLPQRFRQEADDHLGLELDFMVQLSEQCLNAWRGHDYARIYEILNDQKAFLQDHLAKWVPDLTDHILASAQLNFYPGMAKILKGYLAIEREVLEELQEEIAKVKDKVS